MSELDVSVGERRLVRPGLAHDHNVPEGWKLRGDLGGHRPIVERAHPVGNEIGGGA